MNRFAIVLAFLACIGCAVRRPALQTWRLEKQDPGHVLVPPDVAAHDLAQRTFNADVAAASGACPSATDVIALKVRRKQARVTVMRDSLARQPTGWLGAWAYHLEERACLEPGEGMKLAGRIAESVPLEPAAAFRLLHADDRQTGIVDIGPQTRLRVVSPLLREPGLGLMADGPQTVTGKGYSLTVTGKSTDNLLGYETAVYAVQPKPSGIGSSIVPVYADRHMQGAVERTPQPAVNHLQLPREAAFYRLIYKSWQNDFTALLLAARTPAELAQQTKILEASGTSASCEMLASDMCIAIPRTVAVHPLVSITVNGAEVLVSRGTNVLQAIRNAGEKQPDSVLSTLTVYKPWNSRLIPVSFDRGDAAILTLVLRGGETLSWK